MLSSMFRSSRTLPGQRYCWNRRITSGETRLAGVCFCSLISLRK